MSSVNTEFNGPVRPNENLCQFYRCVFTVSSASYEFVYANNVNLRCTFSSCVFKQITCSRTILWLYNSNAGVLDKCCFFDNSIAYIYATGASNVDHIPSAKIHLTVCAKCVSRGCPYWMGSDELKSDQNNNSHLESLYFSTCYLLSTVPVYKDDINCFFSGFSCVGPFPAILRSSLSGSILSFFNFINNTNSDGYFDLQSSVNTIIKCSIIKFSANQEEVKYIHYAASGSSLLIESSFVIAENPIQGDDRVTEVNVQYTANTKTHRPFKNRPNHTLCGPASIIFSFKYDRNLFTILLATSLVIIGTSH